MLSHALDLYIPLILTNIIHMIVVKKNLLSFLSKPMNVTLFGKNKTYRGLIFLTVVNGILHLLISKVSSGLESFVIGALLGLVYIISELPNSFYKRRLGIPAGEKPKKAVAFFIFLDKTDSVSGIVILYALIYGLSFPITVKLFFSAAILHLLISIILVKIKLKESL